MENNYNFNIIVTDCSKNEDEDNLIFSYNMFFLDKKNYLHGICASNIQLFEEEPKIILLSKERKGLDLSSNSKEISFLIGFLRYNENYFIFVVLALEEIKNFRYFLLNILKEIKFFLIFHKVKFLLIENNEAFSSLFRKISKRIDYYFTSLQNKEQKYSIPIDFFMKSLKLCLPNHLPFYQLPELLTQELKRIFGLIFEPITSDLKLFSSSKNSLLPLGSCLFYKGLLLLNSLENELAYYLNSFSELNYEKDIDYFSQMTIFKEEIYYKQQTLQIFLVYFDEYEFHFAFLQISEQTKDPLQSHQILVKELYLQKIKEIFNKFIKNDSLQKISNIFQDFKNKNKKFFKANFYRTSRKICLFFIDSFQDFPAEEIKISNEIFNIFFNNFLEICWKSYSTSFSFVYKDKKEIIDLSYLCPITSEEDNLKIFKFNEEKEDLVLKTEISEKQIVREFFCSWRKTNLILNFYNIKHNNFIEFS